MRDMNDTVIESGRLSMRPFGPADAADAFACITPSLTRFMSWEPPGSRAAFDAVWQAWLPAMAAGSESVFAIRARRDGTFLGLAGVHRMHADDPELGIWIREDRHGHGFGREAVGLAARWASPRIRAASFLYPVAEANVASRRIAESLGGVVCDRRSTPKYDAVVYRIPRQPVTG